MGGSISVLALAAVVILATKLLIRRHKNATTSTPYPPGPKPLFFIGNALDFPKADAGREYVNWGKRYNSLLHFPPTCQPLIYNALQVIYSTLRHLDHM